MLKKYTVVIAAFAAVTVHVAVELAGLAVAVIATPIATIGDATSTDITAVTTVHATTIAAGAASASN